LFGVEIESSTFSLTSAAETTPPQISNTAAAVTIFFILILLVCFSLCALTSDSTFLKSPLGLLSSSANATAQLRGVLACPL
jgi:hypothetical protein